MRWWAPESFGIKLVGCEVDARTGGSYRFTFEVPGQPEPMAFFGKYLEVTPPTRLVWTNEESEDGSVTTVTFEEKDGRTHLVVHDLYPSKEALDAALASESTGAFPEQFDAARHGAGGGLTATPRGSGPNGPGAAGRTGPRLAEGLAYSPEYACSPVNQRLPE